MNGETPEGRYREIQRAVQEAILRDYPNPERKGCPGDAALRALASRRVSREPDPVWDHVSHCSPCYGEYLGFVGEQLRTAKTRNRVLVAGGVALLFALGFWVRGLMLPTMAPVEAPPVVERKAPVVRPEPDVVAAVLNLESQSVTRSLSPTAQPEGEIQQLPRKKLSLTIYLPTGSDVGRYEVRVSPLSTPNAPLASATGDARIVEGLTSLEVSLDLTALSLGQHLIGTRRSGESWRLFRVSVK